MRSRLAESGRSSPAAISRSRSFPPLNTTDSARSRERSAGSAALVWISRPRANSRSSTSSRRAASRPAVPSSRPRGDVAMIGRLRVPGRRLAIFAATTALYLAAAHPALAAGSVPPGAQKALAPVENMIGALVAITIGLGVAISGAVIVWGGIEKTLAGSNADAEHRAHKRIENGIHGLVWMFAASVIVGTITALAVAYGLISTP